MSQDWYRADLHLTSTGAANLDDYLDHHWEPGFTRRKAEDLYAQAATWMASDIRRTSSIMAILFARCRRSGRACC
jgi:homoserine O-acetyltransferase